jgi:CRP/FNR family transcriptional regulator, cyclic AMP receptor protein
VASGDTIEMLRSVRIFAGLSDDELAQVSSIASEVEFPAGHVLTESGQIGSGMFVLLEGRVSVHARGVEVELGPGEVVGELALLRRDSRRIARVQALTPVSCLAISRDPFRALIASDVHLAVALLENLADRVPD